MNDMFSSVANVWNSIREGQQTLGLVEQIPHGRCIPAGSAGEVVKRNDMYFSLRVNQMELDNNRWLDTTYDPLVVIVTEFLYGGARVTVPAVIGPSSIKPPIASDAPRYGTVLSDTRVTGPHPYRGDDVDVSLSFYRVKRSDYTNPILEIVEQLSRAAGAAQLTALAQTGAPLLKGVKALLGVKDTVYLAGQRMSLVISGSVPLQSQYRALVIPDEKTQSVPALEVRDRRLFRAAAEGPQPYRESDFVLFSLEASRHREDESVFPFYALKREAIAALAEGEAGVKRAKANLLIAYQEMRKCDDVTKAEGDEFFEAWLREFDSEKANISRLANMAADEAPRAISDLAADLNTALARVAL